MLYNGLVNLFESYEKKSQIRKLELLAKNRLNRIKAIERNVRI